MKIIMIIIMKIKMMLINYMNKNNNYLKIINNKNNK